MDGSRETKKLRYMLDNIVEVETKWLSNEVHVENEGERRIKSAIYPDLNNRLVPFTETRKTSICCYLAGGAGVHGNESRIFPNKKTGSERLTFTNKYQKWDANPEF